MIGKLLSLFVAVAAVLYIRNVKRYIYINDDADDAYDYIIGRYTVLLENNF